MAGAGRYQTRTENVSFFNRALKSSSLVFKESSIAWVTLLSAVACAVMARRCTHRSDGVESLAFQRALTAQQTFTASSRPSSTRWTLPLGAEGVSRHAFAPSVPQRNSSPLIHMRCRMTASLRATATTALRRPLLFISFMPQALSDDHPIDRVIMA